MAPRDALTVVRTLIARHQLLSLGDTVVVGLSGGADSCALLLSLLALQQDYNLGLHVAHLNHRLRGDESGSDAEFCRGLAEHLNLPGTIGHEDVAALAREQKQSLEEAARDARYRFLEAVREEIGAQRIAVGHTLDDLTETFFLNLFRGSGLDGLVALRPKRGGRLIRPLLNCTHEEAEQFCRSQGVRWREDESNRDLAFLRNRVRHQLVPLIRDELCHDVLNKVGRLSDLLRDDCDDLQRRAEGLLSDAALRLGPEGAELDGETLLHASPALARRALRAAIAAVKGSRHNISKEHVERCFALLRQSSGSREVPLPGLRCLVGSDGHVLISPESSAPSVEERPLPDGGVPLKIPGATQVEPLGLEIVCEVAAAADTPPVVPTGDEALLDADYVGEALWLRAPCAGDRFRPLGMTGSKKLSDLFIDAKVPRRNRSGVPVVAGPSHIVWVVGHQIDDRARLTEQTRRVLRLRALRSQER